MSLGIICCTVLEKEIRTLVRDRPEVTHVEVMEWGLHTYPDKLLDVLTERILSLQEHVQAVMLGYGRCQALDRLPEFKVPVFYPAAEDCIGVLLGQDRYTAELYKEAGTWFMTRGWAEMGTDFIFHELQLNRFAEKGIDPLQVARRMLKDYTRTLLIETVPEDRERLMEKTRAFAHEFNLKVEMTTGSYKVLEETLQRALRSMEH
jgi:hypothetical protein